jgi:hypothetical protein
MILRGIVLLCATQLLWFGGPAASVASPQVHPAGAGCLADTAGLDPSIWNTSRGTFFGRALGQTFLAPDTVITRITVWRPPNQINAVGTRLFVTTVDTAQTPPRPVTQGILQDGPTVFIRDSDPPGQLIRMDFVIEPPLVLQGPGLHAFFLQREGCDAGETIITANDADPYPNGIYWLTGRTIFGPCALRSVTSGEDHTDLIFEIEYCKTDVTPVRARSWGELKLLYR